MRFRDQLQTSWVGSALILLSSVLEGCTVDDTEPAVASARSSLIGGELAQEGQFDATVYFEGICSAVKVSKHRFLTAAHCLHNPVTNRPYYEPGAVLRLSRAKSATVETYRSVTTRQVMLFPAWVAAGRALRAASAAASPYPPDVALLEIAEETADVPVASASALPVVEDDSLFLTGFGCEVGYGKDSPDPPRLKYAETEALDASAVVHPGSPVHSGEESRLWASYFLTPGISEDPAAASLCPGDSGGPVYSASQRMVVGVNAYYTFPEDASAGTSLTNWHTRLDASAQYPVAFWLTQLGVFVHGDFGPSHGIAPPIPHRVQAERYDTGGEGIGFHLPISSARRQPATVRTNDTDHKRHHHRRLVLGETGEWLAYTVQCDTAGPYRLRIGAHASSAPASVRVEIDGADVTGPMELPATEAPSGSASSLSRTFGVAAGPHRVRLSIDSGTPLLDFLEFLQAEPTCSDGLVDGDETDWDCGGSCGATCLAQESCLVDDDCMGGECLGGTCQPTCTDGVRNNLETDVDCGGTCTSKCADGNGCRANVDCLSGNCVAGSCEKVVAEARPCAGLCSLPTIFSTKTFFSKALGTGSACFETTMAITRAACSEVVAPRSLRINGMVANCDKQIFVLPPSRNGGYCFQFDEGESSRASFSALP